MSRINEEKLAQHVVDGMDFDDLYTYAIDRLVEIFRKLSDEELAEEADAIEYEED